MDYFRRYMYRPQHTARRRAFDESPLWGPVSNLHRWGGVARHDGK